MISIAVVSDLHADRREHAAAGTVPVESHLDVSMPESHVSQHPIAALEKLIGQEGLRADLLLCPGDITNLAKPDPLQYAWRRLHDIGRALGAHLVAGTAGNHDLDSRFNYNDHDAKGMVQGLVPLFPVADETLTDRYWSRHYAIIERPDYRLVLLNSAAYHGGNPEEIVHGRVSRRTLDGLSGALRTSGDVAGRINILLCHHHPERHPALALPDYDAMTLGPDLLALLGSGEFGQWLIIHGHKHNPRLTYAGGTASAPVVFSAGSFSAVLYPELQNRVRNQFYLLHIDARHVAQFGLVGSGQAWDYVPGNGWVPAGQDSGMPDSFGFGCRIEPALWTERLAAAGSSLRSWQDVLRDYPELAFVLPADFAMIERRLSERHGVLITRVKGRPHQIGKTP